MKKKEEIYVVIDTPEKAKKVKKLLDMFEEEVYSETYERLANGLVSSEYPLVHFNYEWNGGAKGLKQDKTEVSIKELRNILAVEHLKEGDVVVCRNKKADTHIFEIKNKTGNGVSYNRRYSFAEEKTNESYGGWDLDYFIRYATEEEKSLLEDKPKLEVGKWYKAYLPQYGGYVLAVFNGYNNTSYGIHPDKDGEWFPCHNWFSDFNISQLEYKEATKEEVEQALIKEAKNRYKVGDKLSKIIEDHSGGNRIFSEYLGLQKSDMTLWIDMDKGYSSCIFYNGKWAEIVEPTFVESAPLTVTVIEQLHDLLLDFHGYSLDYKLLRDARELAQKLTKLI